MFVLLKILLSLPPSLCSVVHHASLSASHLLGKYDENMQWTDGFLMRKLREVDVSMHKRPGKDGKKRKADQGAAHVIVLDGPLGFHIEQLFAASHVR